MNKGVVYCYTNKDNGMKYVGRSLRPSRRFLQHLNAELGKHNTYDYFHKAIREIGCEGNLDDFLKHFEFEVLDSFYYDKETKDEINEKLNDLETYYINEFNCVWPNGYNEQEHSKVKLFKLSEEQKQAAINNRAPRKTGYKKNINKMFFETEEERIEKHNRHSAASKRSAEIYWNSDAGIAKREENAKKKAENEARKKQEKEEYWASDEGQQRIKATKEKASKNITEYNKSEAHRVAAAEGNRRRWKNGCPEETRAKLSKSSKGRYKGKHWKIDPETKKRVWY